MSPTFDLTPIVVVSTELIHVVSVATVLLSNHGPTQIPDVVIAEMVHISSVTMMLGCYPAKHVPLTLMIPIQQRSKNKSITIGSEQRNV